MRGRWKRRQLIHGQDVPGPRITRTGVLYFLLFVCLAILGLGVALDTIFYLIFKFGFGACYGVLCLL